MFVELAFLTTAATTALLGYLAHRFLGTLAAEAPQVHAELGSPRLSHYLWNDKLLIAFAQLILSRHYRVRLAAHPRSRAWASWLYLVHWLHLAALLWLIWAMLYG
jgi:hypothetical protein